MIGSPIAHSRSPALHGHWLARYGIDGHYVPLDLSPALLEESLAFLPRIGFVGVNVTIPHKERVLKLADTVTDRAAVMGAANTLTFLDDGRIHADNTDGHGFLENLRQGAPGWRADTGPAAVIGAGGAARAVVASLIEAGASDIRLTNRTRAKSDALRQEFGTKITVFDWVKAGAAIEDAATVVNATSLGMASSSEFRVPLDGLSKDAVVTDLVYTPLETDFLRQAAARGCRTVDGLGMLLHQAAPGFERWFGKRPEVDEAARAAALGA